MTMNDSDNVIINAYHYHCDNVDDSDDGNTDMRMK